MKKAPFVLGTVADAYGPPRCRSYTLLVVYGLQPRPAQPDKTCQSLQLRRQATQASPGDATHTGTRNAAGHHWARAFRVTIHSVQAALDCRIASRRLTSPPHRLRLAVHSTRPASLWPVHADLLPQSTVPRQGKVLTRLLIPDLII